MPRSFLAKISPFPQQNLHTITTSSITYSRNHIYFSASTGPYNPFICSTIPSVMLTNSHCNSGYAILRVSATWTTVADLPPPPFSLILCTTRINSTFLQASPWKAHANNFRLSGVVPFHNKQGDIHCSNENLPWQFMGSALHRRGRFTRRVSTYGISDHIRRSSQSQCHTEYQWVWTFWRGRDISCYISSSPPRYLKWIHMPIQMRRRYCEILTLAYRFIQEDHAMPQNTAAKASIPSISSPPLCDTLIQPMVSKLHQSIICRDNRIYLTVPVGQLHSRMICTAQWISF